MKQEQDPQEHTKYFNSKGTEVPSCTNVVKLLNKPELVGWANYMGFKRINSTQYLQQKAEYGTYCHEIAEAYLTGVVSMSDRLDSLISANEFNELISKLSYLSDKFCSMGISILNTEMKMSGERFGGTLDLLTICRDLNKVILFDFKTSKSVYDSHLIQLGGYSILLEELYGLHVTDIGVILLSQQETSKKFINMLTREQNMINEQIFEKLLDIYWLKYMQTE